MKDKDLEVLLSEYRNQEPTHLQVQKWKRTIRSELNSKKESKSKFWMQLVAASVVGFLIGVVVLKSANLNQSFPNVGQSEVENENAEENATVEYVFTKSN